MDFECSRWSLPYSLHTPISPPHPSNWLSFFWHHVQQDAFAVSVVYEAVLLIFISLNNKILHPKSLFCMVHWLRKGHMLQWVRYGKWHIESSLLTQAVVRCEIQWATPIWGFIILTSLHFVSWSGRHSVSQLEERVEKAHMIYTNSIGRDWSPATFSCKGYYKMWNWSSRVFLANKNCSMLIELRTMFAWMGWCGGR